MDTKKEKQKLIVVSHTKAGKPFTPGNPTLVINPSFKDSERFSPRLAKFWEKVIRAGKKAVQVNTLDYDQKWSARYMRDLGALKEIPDPEATKAATKKSSGKKTPKALTIAKTVKNRQKNNLAKAA